MNSHRLVCVGLVIGLLLAACSSEESSTGTPTGTTTGTSAGTGTGTSTGTETGTGTGTTTGTGTGTGTDTGTPTGTSPGTDPCSGNPYTAITPLANEGAEPDGATAEQHQARLVVDGIRNRMALNPIDFDAALNQASQAHSDYCSTDASWCPNWHDEVAGHPGFTGASFGQRASAAGYTGSPAMEVMAPGIGPEGSIQMWMNSVYHRTPFIRPDINEAGYGHGSGFDTMDFGCCGPTNASLVTGYPVHGQTGVMTAFYGNEGPTPPAPEGGFPSGEIVSVVFPPGSSVTVSAVELFDATCNLVPSLSGGTGLPNVGLQLGLLPDPGVILYANDPLANGALYTINVEYTLEGTPGNYTAQFQTQ